MLRPMVCDSHSVRRTCRLGVPGAWVAPLGDWEVSLRVAGSPDTTIGLRTGWARRLARAVEVPPWEVTGDLLVAWAGVQVWARDTRRAAYASVRAFYAWGVRAGLVETSPADVLPHVRQSEPAPRPCPEHVLREALGRADAQTAVMIRLAGEAGLRRGEVARVHADDLVRDLLGWSLVVHGKGDRIRVVPLGEDLARVVSERARGGWLLPGAGGGGHMTPGAVGHKVGRALGQYTMHSLRHRFATRAYAGSGDLLAVQRLLGHASPATTQRYVLLDQERLRRVMLAAA